MKKQANKELKIKFTPEFVKSANRLFSNNLIYLIPRTINDWKFKVKWAWQRVFRGYDDTTVWNLYSDLSMYLSKIIRDLKNEVHGCPGKFFDSKNTKDECEKWKDTLEKIANGFDAANRIDNSEYMKKIKLKKPRKDMFGELTYTDYKFDKKHYDKLLKEFEDGMDLFKKHFFSLWD